MSNDNQHVVFSVGGKQISVPLVQVAENEDWEITEKWNCSYARSDAKSLHKASEILTKASILNPACYKATVDDIDVVIYRSMSSFKLFEGIVESSKEIINIRKKKILQEIIGPLLYDVQTYKTICDYGRPLVVLEPVKSHDYNYVFRLYIDLFWDGDSTLDMKVLIESVSTLLDANPKRITELVEEFRPIKRQLIFDHVPSLKKVPISKNAEVRNAEFRLCLVSPKNFIRAISLLKNKVNILANDAIIQCAKTGNGVGTEQIFNLIGESRFNRYLSYYFEELIMNSPQELAEYIFTHDTRQDRQKQYLRLMETLKTFNVNYNAVGNAYVNTKMYGYENLLPYYGNEESDTEYLSTKSLSSEESSEAEPISDNLEEQEEDKLGPLNDYSSLEDIANAYVKKSSIRKLLNEETFNLIKQKYELRYVNTLNEMIMLNEDLNLKVETKIVYKKTVYDYSIDDRVLFKGIGFKIVDVTKNKIQMKQCNLFGELLEKTPKVNGVLTHNKQTGKHRRWFWSDQDRTTEEFALDSFMIVPGIVLFNKGPIITSLDSIFLKYITLPVDLQKNAEPQVDMLCSVHIFDLASGFGVYLITKVHDNKHIELKYMQGNFDKIPPHLKSKVVDYQEVSAEKSHENIWITDKLKRVSIVFGGWKDGIK